MVNSREHKKHIGILGETIACRFLTQKGYVIKERNYLEKWGEIDIVAMQNGTTHFVEVKTVSKHNSIEKTLQESNDMYEPEDNIHPQKIKRISRAAETYLKKVYKENTYDVTWQIDAVIVKLFIASKNAKIKHLEFIS